MRVLVSESMARRPLVSKPPSTYKLSNIGPCELFCQGFSAWGYRVRDKVEFLNMISSESLEGTLLPESAPE